MKNKLSVFLTSLLILGALGYGFKFAGLQNDQEFLKKDSETWIRASAEGQAEMATRAIALFKSQGMWTGKTDEQQAQGSLVVCVNTTLRGFQKRSQENSRPSQSLSLSSLLFGCAMEQGLIQPRSRP